VIAKIFTEEFGLQSFMIKGVRSQKTKTKSASMQLLTALDMVVEIKQSRGIQQIREMKIATPFQHIQTDIRKTTIVLFLADVLKRAVHEHEANPELFNFVYHSLQVLEYQDEHLPLFHLSFLLQLAGQLGIQPAGHYCEETAYFNLAEGCFQAQAPVVSPHLEGKSAADFDALAQSGYDRLGELTITRPERKIMLEQILRYFQLHLSSFNGLQSHEILAEVLG
jgi:DNA repair protein RecO (recombination protein O)